MNQKFKAALSLLAVAVSAAILISAFSGQPGRMDSISSMPAQACASQFWHKSGEGMWTAELHVDGGDPHDRLKLLKLDPALYDTEIAMPKDKGKKALSARDMAKESGYSAAINAGYFDENYMPLGYFRTKTRKVNGYIGTPIIYSGMIVFKNGSAAIIHRDSFNPEEWDEAFQAGPRLIAESKPTCGLEKTIDYSKKSRRAGLGFDSRGFIIAAVTAGGTTASWKQMTDTLLNSRHIGIKSFINLDGGTSAQIYAQSGRKTEIDERAAAVPAAIGFRKKNH